MARDIIQENEFDQRMHTSIRVRNRDSSILGNNQFMGMEEICIFHKLCNSLIGSSWRVLWEVQRSRMGQSWGSYS